MTYEWTEDMGEISGFGGGYEATCRAMVIAGIEWLDAHPTANPQFHSYKNIYGVISEDNEDAKALTKAVTCDKVTGGDCTGAMHQASIGNVLFAKKVGWKEFCQKRREHQKKEPTDE